MPGEAGTKRGEAHLWPATRCAWAGRLALRQVRAERMRPSSWRMVAPLRRLRAGADHAAESARQCTCVGAESCRLWFAARALRAQ